MKKIITNKHHLKYDYYLTEEGQVWSEISQKFVSFQTDRYGYSKVRLACYDLPSGRWSTCVHRLMMETFCPIEGMENLQVNHIDGNKKNNSLSNLEWTTPKENIAHAIKNNLRAKVNGAAKLTPEQVIEICELLMNYYPCALIGSLYGVDEDTIGRIRRKLSWKEITSKYDFP